MLCSASLSPFIMCRLQFGSFNYLFPLSFSCPNPTAVDETSQCLHFGSLHAPPVKLKEPILNLDMMKI
ncbi:hypothetical protein CsSME_00051317 [Camellia sinensis var. sinensis]